MWACLFLTYEVHHEYNTCAKKLQDLTTLIIKPETQNSIGWIPAIYLYIMYSPFRAGYSSTLKIKAAVSSTELVHIYQNTSHHVVYDCNIHVHSNAKLKCELLRWKILN
jgi:hypothetical protein